MLLDLTAMEHVPRRRLWTACSVVLALAFVALVGKTLHVMPPVGTPETNVTSPLLTQAPDQSVEDKMDDTHRIGRLLFSTNARGGQTSYVAPFEITSLLILVATIGVIVLCKQDERSRPHRREEITREAPPVKTEENALKN
jgi:NADH:ubiquinone oxidoreductase subunit 6 (subunit J)